MTSTTVSQTITTYTKEGKNHTTVIFTRTDGQPLRLGKPIYRLKSGEYTEQSGCPSPAEESLFEELHTTLEEVQYSCIALGRELRLTVHKNEHEPSSEQLDAVSAECKTLASVKDALTEILR